MNLCIQTTKRKKSELLSGTTRQVLSGVSRLRNKMWIFKIFLFYSLRLKYSSPIFCGPFIDRGPREPLSGLMDRSTGETSENRVDQRGGTWVGLSNTGHWLRTGVGSGRTMVTTHSTPGERVTTPQLRPPYKSSSSYVGHDGYLIYCFRYSDSHSPFPRSWVHDSSLVCIRVSGEDRYGNGLWRLVGTVREGDSDPCRW